MVNAMSNEQRKVVFTEQDEIDAVRLLRVLDERSKKSKRLAGGLGGPAGIQESSKALEKAADDESEMGLGSLNRRPPVAAAEEEDGRGLGSGQVAVSRKCWPAEGNTGRSIACPHHDADSVDSLFSMPVLNGNAHRKGGE